MVASQVECLDIDSLRAMGDTIRNRLQGCAVGVLFSIVNGVIIGLGFIFYAIILSVVFSYVANNFDIISSLLNREDIEDDKNELDLND